jgi:RNA polymerase sigma factor (sigma-70 family)
MSKFPCSSGFLERFRAGEPAALEHVYLAYVDEVATIIRKGVAGAGGGDLEDLLHEVFVRAFSENARRSFDGVRDYGPYLATLTRNLVIDWARRRTRELPAKDADFAHDIAEPAPESEPPWADPAKVAVVKLYLSELPAELRDVHEQRYVLSRSQEDVCRTLGLTRQQLRTRERHLRDGLARELNRGMLRAALAAGPRGFAGDRKINQSGTEAVEPHKA